MSETKQNFSSLTVTFIGGGAMATALGGGFVRSGSVSGPSKLRIAEPFEPLHDKLRSTIGNDVFLTTNNTEAIRGADVIFLAVKPQIMDLVLESIKSSVKPNQLIVSIAAGISLDFIQKKLLYSPIIRVMPNTPALVGEMASGFSLGNLANGHHSEIIKHFLGSVGIAFEVKENLLDAVTGVSGSGPAYVFIMIEAMADGGVRSGLPRNVALQLAAKTVLGAAKMVLTLGKHPGELKDMVTSPNGTTIAAVHALEKAGFRSGIIDAVYTATNRSKELGKL